MKRAETLGKLQVHKQTLAARPGLTGLAPFGSFTRDQATTCGVDTLAGRR